MLLRKKVTIVYVPRNKMSIVGQYKDSGNYVKLHSVRSTI